MTEWHEAIAAVEPHIVRLNTPMGSGTGFLISTSQATGLVAVATAAHVVAHAHYWEQPIRIEHVTSGKNRLLRAGDRAIRIHEKYDTAAIVFRLGDMEFPAKPLDLFGKGYHLKSGVEIGWLGFPAIPRASLCFFSGRISAYLDDDHAYLVDGVAINGVSGGPVFSLLVDSVELMGVVSAYVPNRATGESLPGLAIIRDVEEFHAVTEQFKNLEEAQAQQTPSTEPPLAAATGESEPAEVSTKKV